MKYFLKFSLLSIAVFSAFISFSQNGYFGNTTLSYDDAVIFNEEINYEIAGKKLDFIEFVVSKNIVVELKSQKAVDFFSNYVLTKNEDPLYLAHAPVARNYSPLLSGYKVNYFNVNRVLAEDKKEAIEVKADFAEVQSSSIFDDYYDKYYRISYNIPDLQVGDLINIEFSFTVPYNENLQKLSSNRFFFNSNIFKKKTSIKLSHNNRLLTKIGYFNNAKPDTIIQDETFNSYYWEFENLQPNIYEKGSRAYQQLPYVVFSLFPYDMLYELPNSFQEEFVPYYSIFSYIREEKFVSLLASAYQGVNNKQFSQLRKYIDSKVNSLSDSVKDIEKIKLIHNDIANHFTFSNDVDYFKKRDTRNPRMGDYITKESIRDIKRYDVYAFILFELNYQFFSVYLADNRYAEISDEYFRPMAESDFLFAIMADERVHFLYPKKSRFGYLFGEIPFYFQNTNTRFVHLSDYRAYEQPINTAMRKIKMPGSGLSDNYRKTNTLVNVNLQNNTVSFSSRINLSGQYSTMTRGVYQYTVKDLTVNPLYNQKIWENISGLSDTSAQVEITNMEFPFNANINASFSSTEIIEQHQDTISISIAHWFKHILYPDMEVDNRSLDFYPDFQGRDTYVYFLKFDQEVQYIDEFEKINLKNDFGELEITISQIDTQSVKITSSFATIAEKIKAEDIQYVGDFFHHLEQLNHYQLQFITQ